MNQMGLSLQHLLQYTDEGEDMLNRIVTGDESWVYLYQHESKGASMPWKHPSSFSTKKFKVMLSAGKVMLPMFRDSQGVILAYFQQHGENVNSAKYCEVLLKLQDAICRKHPGQLTRGVLIHCDNARLHAAQAPWERIRELQWELLEHLPYSLDLAPSDFHLSGLLKKKHLGGKYFTDDDEEVDMELQKWLRQQSKQLLCCGF